ncbi:sensor histidine kinase [Fulvivirga imtechensis AK7]|uniref:histidine kinase n=1 Tax=Fulvivirga imtechensis AK7 TaxID=1237149 RepID=L8JMB2_9BACT|nr:HAMP domain-containing sensor histidine kinase [Fulvivirga imtechensis]ELR69950.1 sensor histidine kinase [Fulvivirga imtechensis AK7]
MPFDIAFPGTRHRVKVHIEDNDDALQIIISDNGRGIKKDIQDKIFEMFFKGEYCTRKNGMGLFIAKTAVDKLYGKIHVDSEEGLGTVVTVVLP